MSNPLLRRYAGNPHGRRSEKRVAKRVSGRLTPGSGSLPGAKGDVRLPSLLLECKATVNDSLSLKLAWLNKITGEALDQGKAPALAVSFVVGSGKARENGDWLVIPAWLAKQAGITP